MIKQRILEDLKKAVEELGYPTTDIVISIPKNPAFGDYSTNLALQLSKLEDGGIKQNPQEIANKILEKFGKPEYLEKAESKGGGFINFFIKDEELINNLEEKENLTFSDSKKILVEYGHVNLLKEIHIGHLRTFILGESLSRIFEALGHKVFRANYQGDIGLHIAKAIWGIEKLGLPSSELNLEEKAQFLGRAYAEGNKSYEEDEAFKKEIDEINRKLYLKDPEFEEIYVLARGWSLEYFEPIYELLGIKYDAFFFESEVFERGKQVVLENIGRVFEENAGAVIFPGEKYARLPDGQGLHTRVFVSSAGNPTYEGKDMGLAEAEYEAFNYDNSIHVVASEQEGYFRVIIKAIELLFPNLKGKKHHLSYGLVDLKQGKMSSRTGNVVTVDDLVSVVSEKVREIMKSSRLEVDQAVVKQVALGAIKFAYLKFSPRPNMVFDLEESVSLDGDSGPYIQYTHARIQSVLKKTTDKPGKDVEEVILEKQERLLLRHLTYFPEVVNESATSLHPNLLASYLIELSKIFNLFYQQSRIIGSDKQAFRLKLAGRVAEVLKLGLNLLGIEAPERM